MEYEVRFYYSTEELNDIIMKLSCEKELKKGLRTYEKTIQFNHSDSKYDFYSPEDNSVIIATAYSPNENLYSSSESIMTVQMPKIYRNETNNLIKLYYIGSIELNYCNISFPDGEMGVDEDITNNFPREYSVVNDPYEDTLGQGITMRIQIGEFTRTINVRFTNNFDEVQSYYTEISLDGNDFHHLDGQSPTYIGSQGSETKSFTIISNEEENNYLRNNNFYVRISTMDTVRFGHCYGNFSKANASPIYVDKTDDTTCTFRIPKWNIDKGEVNLEVEIHEP